MKFTWSNHAQFRLHERHFSVEEVKAVIRNPDFTKHVGGGKLASAKRVQRGMLEVVYIKRSKDCLIITAYFQ